MLNIAQLLYFLCYNPSVDKLIWAAVFTLCLSAGFYLLIRSLSRQTQAVDQSQLAVSH
ncbi:hypothetical protein [Rheinheimera soli]|uniref:Uncharacterized protein n=1 Tax=Rheinheimera soli TaxID=443616 RepID=A0ABU1W5C9_9GAMM|nr:hypothetical protein [Rheinheimera soli]MDR7122928.1 hypothetical protein [Rheinheimera soli]